MDHYPQPRPVLYGTTYPEKPPQTQTQPVLTGPPRWPPAPPSAGFAPEPDDNGSWNYFSGQTVDPHLSIPPAFTLLAVLYALTSTYALLQFVPGFSDPDSTPRSLTVLIVEVAVGAIVVLSLLTPGGLGYFSALFAALLHLALGLLFGQWYSPGVWVALAVSIVLLLPSNRLTYGTDALRRWQCHRTRRNRKHPPRSPRRHIVVSRKGQDDWRMRW